MISSLGLIEVVGLVGAIEAADTAVKAANVRVIDYEPVSYTHLDVYKRQSNGYGLFRNS